jgi:uncharacterized protein (TIGR02270 family)
VSTASRARQKFLAESRVIEPIVSQYAEEAAFLWLLRDAAVRSPNYSLRELARLDSRIDAHLDGLTVAGEHGWRVCVEELDWEEPGEVYTASAIAFASNDVSRIQPILEVVRQDTGLTRAMIAAIGYLPHKKVIDRISQLSGSHSDDLRFIGLSASAIHRIDPGTALPQSLESESPRLRVRARRAVGEFARRDLMPQLRAGLKDDDPEGRFWAAWSLGVLGDRDAAEVLREFEVLEFGRWRDAVNLVSRTMDLAAAHTWRVNLASTSDSIRQSILAAGAIGDPIAIDWLIGLMSDKKFARVAGEAFTTITGADLVLLKLELASPDDSETGPTDDPEDDNVEMDPDEDLPCPDPLLVQAWWSENKGQYVAGKRYLLGNVIGSDSLAHALRTGNQRHRAAAALEMVLSASNSAKSLFEVRAHARVQQRLLG